MPDESNEARVDAHLRALDEQLDQLRRLDAALDARAKRTQAELHALQRRVAELSERGGGEERRERPPSE